MIHQITRIVAPATPVLSLDDVKAHLRVTGDHEDALITSLVEAATAWLDGWRGVLGIALQPQTWKMTLDRFPAGVINLPLGPVISIEAVKYTDATGDEQTVPPTDYEVQGARIRPVPGWPTTSGAMGAVRVEFVAGEGAPESIKHVVRLLVAHWYENREATGGKMEAVPMAVDMLIAPIRVQRI